MRRTLAGALAVALPAGLFACNGILGIDAPTLLPDAATEGGRRDAPPDSSTHDATVDARPRRDARLGDAPRDSMPAHDAERDARPGRDAPTDVQHDSRLRDAPTADSPRDAGHDSAQDAPRDSAHDAPHDSGRDAPRDAPPDVAPVFDGNCTCEGISDGGLCPVFTVASSQTTSRGIVADPEAGVLWLNRYNNGVYMTGGSIWRADLRGPPAQVTYVDGGLPAYVAYRSGFVYWTDELQDSLDRCALPACSRVEVLANGEDPQGLVVTSTTAYFAVPLSNAIFDYRIATKLPGVFVTESLAPGVVVTDGTNLYWNSGDGVYGCPLTGCQDDMPVSYGRSVSPASLAVSAGNVLWSDDDSEEVYSTSGPSDGGTVVFSAEDAGVVFDDQIAADAEYLYVLTANAVLRVDLQGGGRVTLATGWTPTDVAVGATCVFWLDDTNDAGHVYATQK